MKILATILSFIIIGLCTMPCADGAIQKEQTTGVFNCNDENHTDVCSPFCVCSCCNTATIFQEVVVLEEMLLPEMRKQREETIFIQTSLPYYSIWQPPQLF